MNSGETRVIKADRDTFAEYGGELRLQITDAEGDKKEIRTKVGALVAEIAGQSSEMSDGEDA